MNGYLYYSKNCPPDPNCKDSPCFCYNLMKMIENNKLNDVFTYVSIDDMSSKEMAQLPFDNVPTLIVNINGKQSIHCGPKSFEWVRNFLMGRRQVILKNAEKSRRIMQSNITVDNFKNNMNEFCPNEQTGISDTYSFWNDDIKNDVNIALPKTFKNYDKNDINGDNIVTIPIGNLKEYKKREGITATYGTSGMDKLIEQKLEERKQQTSRIQTTMEKERFDTILTTAIKNLQ